MSGLMFASCAFRIDTPARHLVFHRAIVLLFGLLSGAPYARAINRKKPAPISHAWRVAHASLADRLAA